MRVMAAAVMAASALAAATMPAATAARADDAEVEQIVRRHVQPMLIAAGGMAVVVHIDGRSLFFNYGLADVARKEPITSDSLFNLASVGKVFLATLLAQAVERGEVALDDPVAKYVTELQQGGDIRNVTLGELASHTSGLTRTPQQYEHRGPYKLADFIRYLNAWQADAAHAPGKQDIYSNTGFVLLALALQRRFDAPIAQLMETRLLAPLGMTSTALPVPRANARGQLAPELRRRAVQGYNSDAQPVGEPGQQQGIFNWPGTGQMYSSARDMARFLAANLGELPVDPTLQAALQLAQRGSFPMSRRVTQALAWEVDRGPPLIVEKNGGLNNTTAYIGMMPAEKIGTVILSNRGSDNTGALVGRRIMLRLVGLSSAEMQGTGARN